MKKADKEYLARVAALGCVVCRNLGFGPSPAIVHHITGNKSQSRKAPHSETLPLCPRHHYGHGIGVSVHDGVQTWEAEYGTQRELLEQVRRELG